jgi:nitrite reductase/ring-hydroxylating ferredoxin subunit
VRRCKNLAHWVRAIEESALEEQARVEIEGEAYALFRLDDGVYALDDVCSHEYSRLSEGEIWDDEVYCPKHGSRFSIRSGDVRSFPAFKPVGSYPVKTEDGWLFIDAEGKDES